MIKFPALKRIQASWKFISLFDFGPYFAIVRRFHAMAVIYCNKTQSFNNVSNWGQLDFKGNKRKVMMDWLRVWYPC